eukprot:15358002-Ditylum_brightwellii.AAC.1
MHKQTPTQPTIIEFFQQTSRQDAQPALRQTQHWRHTDTEEFPAIVLKKSDSNTAQLTWHNALCLLLPDQKWSGWNQK